MECLLQKLEMRFGVLKTLMGLGQRRQRTRYFRACTVNGRVAVTSLAVSRLAVSGLDKSRRSSALQRFLEPVGVGNFRPS